MAKFDPTGTTLWKVQAGTFADDLGLAVAVDAQAQPLLAGSTGGSLAGVNGGEADAFVLAYRVGQGQ